MTPTEVEVRPGLPSARRALGHVYGITVLLAPPWIAWTVALAEPRRAELIRVVTLALGPIFFAVLGALTVRAFAVLAQRRGGALTATVFLEQLDILTPAGRSLAILSCLAVVGAIEIGWASLAAVGLLGMGLLYLVTLYAFFALRRVDLLGGGSLERRFVPVAATEGETVIEEIELTNVRLPVGFRLFMKGRVGPRWAETRHVLEASEVASGVLLENDIGRAVRGEHAAEPLEVWLEDIFGLCQAPCVRLGAAKLSVVPRQAPVSSPALLDRGMGPRAPRRELKLPTEGLFHLREYREGDDVRRIHWVRSLAAGELIVRLPDELPPDQPHVRVVLDTFFPEALATSPSCHVVREMLDLLVVTWLGVAARLAEEGVNVMLVVAAPDGKSGVTVKRWRYRPRSAQDALRLGAEVEWQSSLPISELLTDEATYIVSRGVLITPPSSPRFRWILVPPVGLSEPRWTLRSDVRTPHPLGHPENGAAYRRRALRAFREERREHDQMIRTICTNVAAPPPGSLVARPSKDGITLETIS